MNESQRAMVAAKIANMSSSDFRGNQHTANLQEATTRAEAADQLNVSERSVNSAKKVQSQGTAELNDRVEQGEVSVSAAATIAAIPEEEQEEIAERE